MQKRILERSGLMNVQCAKAQLPLRFWRPHLSCSAKKTALLKTFAYYRRKSEVVKVAIINYVLVCNLEEQ